MSAYDFWKTSEPENEITDEDRADAYAATHRPCATCGDATCSSESCGFTDAPVPSLLDSTDVYCGETCRDKREGAVLAEIAADETERTRIEPEQTMADLVHGSVRS